ncbi:glycosyl hydrolase family 10 protein [Ascodesmis nigricans]|uniref:Beta-xylanase n=1 Tax=Ascodesmis nigricans TaxID=341454 RepID=A0A4S2N3V0_9PEZI|nr:glycosyl hydrolase family 10 protein [Ascodesmis nigricans]
MAPLLNFLLASLLGSTIAACSLDAHIKKAGKEYFGVATDPNTLNIPEIASIVDQEFGSVTPENSMKWDSTEPSQNNFNFAKSDILVSFAQSHNKTIRGHTLIWHSQLPNWVTTITSPTVLRAVLTTHITTLVTRYKGLIHHWDVVNEVFNEDGSLRDSVFLRVLGEEYIPLSFRIAHAADPDARLYINDYNLDFSGPKLEGMVALVNRLVQQGVPVHGIGTQAHLVVGNGAIPYFRGTLERLVSTGLEVAVTELDVRMAVPVTEERLRRQREDYALVVKACREVQRCVGVTVWGVSDKHSWVPNTFPGQGAALLWDEEYKKKLAYEGVESALA